MFHVTIVAVGKMRDANFAEVTRGYLTRVKPFAKVEMIEVPATPFKTEGEISRAKEKEAEALRAALAKLSGKVYLLDEAGEELDSKGFADFLGRTPEPLVFVVGGAAGFSDALKKEHRAISLSRLTLPHELARAVLAEQLYRAVTMNQKRNKYHY